VTRCVIRWGAPCSFVPLGGQARRTALERLEGQKAQAVLADKAYDNNELREIYCPNECYQ